MISVIAGGLIFSAMIYAGILVKNQYALRYKNLKEINDFASFMLREISMYKTPVNSIIDKFTIDKDKSNNILVMYKEQVNKDFNNIYQLTDHIYFMDKDRQLITGFLSNIGKANLKEEKKLIENFIKEINLLVIESKTALDKDGKLYSQLLALIGFAIMIIVV